MDVAAKKQGDQWFTNSGARIKRDESKSEGLDSDEYLKLQLTSDFDETRREQFKTIRKDVHAGRTDAANFRPDLAELLTKTQISRFGEADYLDENRREASRVLQAYAQRNHDPGYVQGMNYLVAVLQWCMSEEDAFWTLCTLIEDLRPPDFYSRDPALPMNGFEVEKRVVSMLVQDRLPKFCKMLGGQQGFDMLVQLTCTKYLIPMMVNAVSARTMLFVWNKFFCYGGEVMLVSAVLALMALTHDAISSNPKAMDSSDQTGGYGILLGIADTITPDELDAEMSSVRSSISPAVYKKSVSFVRWEEAQKWLSTPDCLTRLRDTLRFTQEEVGVLAKTFSTHFCWEGSNGADEDIDDVMNPSTQKEQKEEDESKDGKKKKRMSAIVLKNFIKDKLNTNKESKRKQVARRLKSDEEVYRYGINGCMTASQFSRLVSLLHVPGSGPCHTFCFDNLDAVPRPNVRYPPRDVAGGLLQVFDRDRTGYINFKQAVSYLSVALKGTLEDWVSMIYLAFDRDGIGLIRTSHYACLMKSILLTWCRKHVCNLEDSSPDSSVKDYAALILVKMSSGSKRLLTLSEASSVVEDGILPVKMYECFDKVKDATSLLKLYAHLSKLSTEKITFSVFREAVKTLPELTACFTFPVCTSLGFFTGQTTDQMAADIDKFLKPKWALKVDDKEAQRVIDINGLLKNAAVSDGVSPQTGLPQVTDAAVAFRFGTSSSKSA